MDADKNIAAVKEYRRLMQQVRDTERKATEVLKTIFPEGAVVNTPNDLSDTVEHATCVTVWCKDYGYLAEDMIRANYPEAG